MMKKILFVVPSLDVGGMERVLVTYSNMLAQKGYDVTVMLFSSRNPLLDELFSGIRVVYRSPKRHLGNRIPYIRHKLYDSGMWEKRTSPKNLYQYYIGKEKYDVEIAFFRGLFVKIVSGSVNKNAVHLAWVHNDFRQAKGYQNCFRSLVQVRDAYARFDRVICVSRQAEEGFAETVGDTGNLMTVYNPLPAEQIRRLSDEAVAHRIRKAKLHLVNVARLEDAAKGQLRLIDAVCRLRREGESISLSVVGGGKDAELIRQAVRENGAEAFIELTGEKKNPYPYIKDAGLLVCSSYYEGFNLTVGEAMILGVPVLSTDCTGPNEILDGGKYGMIVENSGDGIYQGLKKLCEDPALLKEYKEKAIERQDFFDSEKQLKRITDLF